MGFRTCYPQRWHLGSEYYELKESEWIGRSRKVTLTPPPFSAASDHKSQVRGVLPRHRGKEPLYLRKWRDAEKNLNKQAILSVPVHWVYLLLLIYHILSRDCPRFIKPSKKHTDLSLWVFISLWSLLCHVKLTLSKFVYISPANLSL